ncbi:MAG: HAMP domain-containing protein [Deltaproteobacteria bacterium]|nr:HAMP domain-containing protein [Deltaproteobacteria bacterium]
MGFTGTISLKTKFLVMTLGLVALLGAVNLYYMRAATRDLLRNDLIERGLILGRNIAHEAVQPVPKDLSVRLRLIAREHMSLDPEVGYVFFQDSRGRVLSHTFKHGFPADLGTANPITEGKTYSIQPIETEQGRYLDLALPIQHGQAGVVHVGLSEQSNEDNVQRILLTTSAMILLVIALGGVLAVLLTNLITRPLRELTSAAEALGRGEMGLQVRVRTHDEVGRLAAEFNDMSARLAQLLSREREFAARAEAATKADETARALQRAETSKQAMMNVMEDLEAARAETQERNRRLEELRSHLVRSNRDLEQFAYVASHDLQEPLRMVSSYNQLLAKKFEGRLDDKADGYIRHSVEGVRRMQDLITDLLAYSRVGTRGGTFKEVAMGDAFDIAADNLSIRIKDSDAIVTRDEMPRLMADEVQITQLFQNLLLNALKYRSEASPMIHASARQGDGEWVFSVRDNGIGIDPKDQERIFIIFQRLHARDEYSGTGIGLAVCKRIVERHSGRIWVESEPGKGSTFFFTIPTRQPVAKDG